MRGNGVHSVFGMIRKSFFFFFFLTSQQCSKLFYRILTSEHINDVMEPTWAAQVRTWAAKKG